MDLTEEKEEENFFYLLGVILHPGWNHPYAGFSLDEQGKRLRGFRQLYKS